MDNWTNFIKTTGDLLEQPDVKRMRDIPHHRDISCFEHSVYVAYTAYCAARKFNLDSAAVARAGLLHDFYLYDSNKAPRVKHCFLHASHALVNARKICKLSKKEENIILSHMWPLGGMPPLSREARIVGMCDKYCASVEGLKMWKRTKMKTRIQEIMP